MKIWVDADACPAVIKEILFKTSERLGVPLILVANHPMRVPHSPRVSMLRVASGFDVADNEIVGRLNAGDLVITADIPLAGLVLAKGGYALDPRGELFSPDTIKARLQVRDFMATLRDSGVDTGGPPPQNLRDRQKFANQLDSLLTRLTRTT